MKINMLERTICSLACDIPGATSVFHALADLHTLTNDTHADMRSMPADALIDHILVRYHDHHREQLPELIRLARRVEQVHGDRTDCPKGLADHLVDMQQELESHMMKEEQVLFPVLRRAPPAKMMAPISMMRFEHDQHGEALQQMERLTRDITAPQDACNTWRALYAGLTQLREDLMQHIHLENNVLFMDQQEEAVHV